MGTEAVAAPNAAKRINVRKFEEFLDRATDEVFSTMLGSGCAPTEASVAADHGAISAVIGLAGAMSGFSCCMPAAPRPAGSRRG